jgi:hypothetical protein
MTVVTTTYVHYVYRAPKTAEDVGIKAETWPDKTPRDVWPLLGSVGEVIDVWPDDPEEHGEGPKKYKVLGYQQATTQVGGDIRTVSNMVRVIVTDPDE